MTPDATWQGLAQPRPRPPPIGPGGLCPEGTPTFDKDICCLLFHTLQQFTIDLIKTLHAESDAGEFSVVTFATDSKIITNATTAEDAIDKAMSLTYSGGQTNHMAASEFF